MKDKPRRNTRLTTRLAVALLVTLLAVLILATIAAAVTAYRGAIDFQDETLLSVAHLVNSDQIQVQYDPRQFNDDDFDDGVRVWEIGGDSRYGFKINQSVSEGFHTLTARKTLWRVLVTKHGTTGRRYAIVQKLGVSTEMAGRSAFNTAAPLLGLILLVPILITLIVRHSLKPLQKLSAEIAQSNSLQLDVSNRKDIPVEILPFASAIDALLKKNVAYNEQQRRFIADAAHELRTPITALSLEIENVQKARSDDAREKRQASLMLGIQRLQRLVNQLLDLARAQSVNTDAGNIVSLGQLVRTQVAELYVLAESKNIEIVVSRNDDAPVLDKNHQLQHLIRNALSNAIKFAPMRGCIDIEVARVGNECVLNVVDNGPGVDSTELVKLREPFYRASDTTSGTGAGLGLAICHEIAAKLNGRLVLANVEPTGFRFSYAQPVAIESA